MDYLPLLIPLIPLLAALLTALPERFVGEGNYRVGAVAHGVALVLAAAMLWRATAPDFVPVQVTLWPSPFAALPTIALRIDRLAAVMQTLVAGIGMLLYVYARRYMQQEAGRARYQTLLAIAVATLLAMVSSADLLTLVITWQLLSWLLSHLAFNIAHPPTAQSAFRTFVTLRAGDVAFLGGIVLAYHLYGTLAFEPLFARAAADPGTIALGAWSLSGTTAVTLLFFVGAMSKSAQFPLHLWLPDSLYSPTPTCALLHAGIINAGGFLLNRLAPLYALSAPTLHVVLVVGILTLLAGKSVMLVQNNIKETLVYSTIGQMGYMIVECGLGAFGLAIFHLIAHGLFKATLFLNSGNEIHAARLHPPTPTSTDGPPPSLGRWIVGFVTTLILPLAIVLGTHQYLHIPLRTGRGMLVFLVFSWATAVQAMLTLYRIGLADSLKAQGLMVLTLVVASLTYLAAAERFTHFLYPEPGRVTAYLKAAALPPGVFYGLMGAFVIAVVVWWTAAFAERHGSTVAPNAFTRFRTRLYLFLLNRLYLDHAVRRTVRGLRRLAKGLDRHPAFRPAVMAMALAAAWVASPPLGAVPLVPVVQVVAAALLLPLFPAHGLYVTTLSRLPGARGIALALAMPVAGTLALAAVLPTLPVTLLPGIAVLALAGALYASMQALLQDRVPELLAYAGMAFASVTWWHAARSGALTLQAVVFTGAATLVTVGLLLAWDRIRHRYGDLDLTQIGGLAGPMPRLGLMVALLVMVAAGLPPFGLFAGFVGMVLQPPAASSVAGLAVVLVTWMLASWYFFKLIQRLLFGPARPDLVYSDLRPVEMVPFAVTLLLLLVLGGLPQGVTGGGAIAVPRSVEVLAWIR